jgi:rhamnose utilization protein RhaD (predicted bifunctional aldolase and dehydrogenase)
MTGGVLGGEVPDKHEILRCLVAMSREIGQPEKDYVILSEGNTSARIGETTFWVKASGVEMYQIDTNGFVEMAFDGVLATLDSSLSDEQVKQGLAAARVDPTTQAWPSMETVLHGLALTLGGAQYVAHTHPTSIKAILCSQGAEAAFAGHIFPAEAVVCGEPLFVPYASPGQPLARAVREGLLVYNDRYDQPPRVILLQNHGLVALGPTPEAVFAVTAMMVRAARALLGTYVLGGPRFIEVNEG